VGRVVHLISQAHVFFVDGLPFFRRFAIGAHHVGIVEHFLVKKVGVILGGRGLLTMYAVSYRRGHMSIFPFPLPRWSISAAVANSRSLASSVHGHPRMAIRYRRTMAATVVGTADYYVTHRFLFEGSQSGHREELPRSMLRHR